MKLTVLSQSQDPQIAPLEPCRSRSMSCVQQAKFKFVILIYCFDEYTLRRYAMTIGYDKGTLCFTLSDKEMLTWLVFLHWSTHRSCFNLMSSLQLEQSHVSYNATTLHSGSGWNAQVITSSKITKNMHPLWCWCLHGLPPTVKPYSDTIRTKKWIWTNDGEKKLEKMVETLKNDEKWKMTKACHAHSRPISASCWLPVPESNDLTTMSLQTKCKRHSEGCISGDKK